MPVNHVIHAAPVSYTKIETRISRYAPRYRQGLRELGYTSRNHADLLWTFPAACVSVTSGRGRPEWRGEALWLIRNGSPIAEIAGALDLPLWMRRLPPETFGAPLPKRIGEPRGDKVFGRRIVNKIPDDPEAVKAWFQRIMLARTACDDRFALWIASLPVPPRHRLPLKAIAPLSAFAWYSQQTGHRACKLIDRRWTDKMAFHNAVLEMRNWIQVMLLDNCVDRSVTGGSWYDTDHVCGYDFVPLRTAWELMEEGRRMKNCVPSYIFRVLQGATNIFSIRRRGVRVADMEVRMMRGSNTEPVIRQLKGPENAPVRTGVQRAAKAWLALQMSDAARVGLLRHKPVINAQSWRRLLNPYWSAKGPRGAIRPDLPSNIVSLLSRDINALGRLARK